jgi:hypothetical protein
MKGPQLVASLAALSVLLLLPVSPAGSGAKRQRIAIDTNSPLTATAVTFALRALTPGSLRPDGGRADVDILAVTPSPPAAPRLRDGQPFRSGTVEVTLKGRRGTLVLRVKGDFEIPAGGRGYEIAYGTWSVVRGTAAYAGLSGGGRFAGVTRPTDDEFSELAGLVSTR